MLVLIAESKTMKACDSHIASEQFASNSPSFIDVAKDIMFSLRDMSSQELSKYVKISLPYAYKLQEMIFDFPDCTKGLSAIEAYTGVVFRAFGYPSLDGNAQAFANSRVRIISSLYGYLRPTDIVKAYRFDFTTKLAPGNVSFAAFWKQAVTEILIEDLKAGQHSSVLNLLPGDAAKCIDWKRVSEHAAVLKADFLELRSGGSERTPNSGRLKTLRGRLLRQIVEEEIDDAAILAVLSSESYIPADFSNGTIKFHTLGYE